mmetsp:Transcript_143398/g.250324  ORF Transcript_143398/g.250324 Transcript_143398/m.250324 type:complete len:107 (+) Transcript_143398:188-508(+)
MLKKGEGHIRGDRCQTGMEAEGGAVLCHSSSILALQNISDPTIPANTSNQGHVGTFGWSNVRCLSSNVTAVPTAVKDSLIARSATLRCSVAVETVLRWAPASEQVR